MLFRIKFLFFFVMSVCSRVERKGKLWKWELSYPVYNLFTLTLKEVALQRRSGLVIKGA